jgi:hypothetical protein
LVFSPVRNHTTHVCEVTRYHVLRRPGPSLHAKRSGATLKLSDMELRARDERQGLHERHARIARG